MDLTETYRGYTGSIEYSENDQVFYGKVLGHHRTIVSAAFAQSFASSVQL